MAWRHYRSLIRIDKPQAREWDAKEAVEQGWIGTSGDAHRGLVASGVGEGKVFDAFRANAARLPIKGA